MILYELMGTPECSQRASRDCPDKHLFYSLNSHLNSLTATKTDSDSPQLHNVGAFVAKMRQLKLKGGKLE